MAESDTIERLTLSLYFKTIYYEMAAKNPKNTEVFTQWSKEISLSNSWPQMHKKKTIHSTA